MELTKYNRTDINDYQDMTTDDMTMNVTTDSDMKVIRHNSIMTRAGGTATTLLRRMMILLLLFVTGQRGERSVGK